VVGWQLAQDGASLEEVLDGLRATSLEVLGEEPSFEDISALCAAWSESTLAYLHQMSCEDPMTGLTSLAHVRTRLSELYRGELRVEGSTQERFALVVADLPEDIPGMGSLGDGHLSRAMRVARLGEATRTVFAGTETIGRLGDHRVVVVVERSARLGRRVALLRKLLAQIDLSGHVARVWIEGLPPTDTGAAMLLDELARP
jgi:GGDEF domain-containing protein